MTQKDQLKNIQALQTATKAIYRISDSEECAASIFMSLALTVLTDKYGEREALGWIRGHISQNPYLQHNEQKH
tara:strand:+ start:8001 stop:8219 length:219 start_codon:yes stop_codon:yes gene_type:complete